MSGRQLLAIGLITAGVLGLMYGSFSYTKETHEAKIGPRAVGEDKETVNVPIWAGVGAIVVGASCWSAGEEKLNCRRSRAATSAAGYDWLLRSTIR